jgi:hypothetical protein
MFNCRVRKIRLLVSSLTQMNLDYVLIDHLFEIKFNIVLPSTPRSSERSLSFRLFKQNLARTSHLSHIIYISDSSHTP